MHSPLQRLLSGDLLRGKSGAVVLIAICVIGQGVWLLYGLNVVAVSDSLAGEGIIIAVAFGILTLRSAVQHEERLSGISGKLGGVSAGLTEVSTSVLTRTLGVFPDFFRYVPPMLARAEKNVRVMCDLPAYAIVSSGPEFDAYLGELKRCIGLCHGSGTFFVDLLFLDRPEREELHRVQVVPADQSEWHGWRETAKENLRDFFVRGHQLRTPELAVSDDLRETANHLDLDDYVSYISEVNDAVLFRHLFGANRRVLQFRDENGVTRARTNGPSVYFWMRDDREAIFVIVPLGPQYGGELAFTTHDPQMIAALNGVFDRYASASIQVT